MNKSCIETHRRGHSPISEQIFITTQADVAISRRIALNIAQQAGFSQRRCAQVSIVVSEIGTNLVKHAKQGGLLKINLSFLNHIPFLSISSFDKGPGISSIKRAMLDGVSATETLGTGLGAIYRLSNRVAICSKSDINKSCPHVSDIDWNTILVSQIWDEDAHLPLMNDEVEFSSLLEPMQGSIVCGDGVHVVSNPFFTRFVLMDGSGRGNGAAEAVCQAIKMLNMIPAQMPIKHILESLEFSLSDTQGLAMIMLQLDHKSRRLYIQAKGSLRLTLGLDDKLYEFSHPVDFFRFKEPIDLSKNQSVFAVLYTDGVGRIPRFENSDMLKDISTLIWTQLLFRHLNIKDDAAILVIKWRL